MLANNRQRNVRHWLTPRLPVLGENAGEWYAATIDAGFVFPWGRRSSWTPAHPAVYGGGQYQTFGCAYGGQITGPGMNVLSVQSLCWGSQLGWWNAYFHETHSGLADFARKCVQVRHRLTGFFTSGEFLERIPLNVPTISTTGSKGETIESPENAVWRQDAENEVLFVFANPTDILQKSTNDYMLADYGLQGPVDLLTLNPNEVLYSSRMSNSFTKTIELNPRSVRAWVVSEPRTRDVAGTSITI